MSTLNDADESGGKPANNMKTSSMNSNNTNMFGAASNNDSSLALLQQVQSILLENNDAKARMMELENQLTTLQTEREDLTSKLDEEQTASQQMIQRIQQQMSQKDEEFHERYETQKTKHKSDLQMLQDKLDEWEFQHQDWTTKENEYQKSISNLEESKTQLKTAVQQLEADLEASKAEATQLRKDQTDASKAHEENVSKLNIQIESLQNDMVTQELEQLQERQRYDEQKQELEQTLQKMISSVQEKDILVQTLEGTIGELRLEVSQLKEDQQVQVQGLEATICNLEQENIAQSTQAEEYQTQIEKLEQELNSLNSIFLEQQKEAEQKEEEDRRKQEDDEQDSKWQEVVQSLQIQVQAQTNIAETKSQELEDSKSQNMQLRVQLQVLTQQKDQLERNWTEPKEQLQSVEDSRITPQSNDNEEAANDSVPQDRLVNQDQAIASLTEENNRLNDRIVQMEAQLVLGGARGLDGSDHDGNNTSENNDDTIAQLQQRIMHLVEEKLILQTTVETLEHQVTKSCVNGTGRQPQQEKRSPAMTMKEYWHNRQTQLQSQQPEPPAIVVDENTDQADIIRQTMIHQKSQKLTRRISKKVLGSTATGVKPIRQIDVKAAERLFYEEKQKREKAAAQKGKHQTNLSNARMTTGIDRSSWTHNRDHGMTSPDNEDLPGYVDQQEPTQAARRSSSGSMKKEKTTTWTRIRDTIAGQKASESESNTEIKIEPTSGDDFSLWVQELNREQQTEEEKESSMQLEEFKSLSEPASMLDSLPGASPNPMPSNAGRYAVQTIDDLLNGGADAVVEELKSKEDGAKQETRETQTYRVLDPNRSKPKKKIFKEDEQKAAVIGAGQPIDQSNLIGFYVNKQKEAANSTTMGYLSSMIYGDPVEEESKMQQKILKRQLARKKKQEQKEKAEWQIKEVQDSVMNKPKTVFSSFI